MPDEAQLCMASQMHSRTHRLPDRLVQCIGGAAAAKARGPAPPRRVIVAVRHVCRRRCAGVHRSRAWCCWNRCFIKRKELRRHDDLSCSRGAAKEGHLDICLFQDACIAHAVCQLEVITATCRLYRGPVVWLSSKHRIAACKQMLMRQDAQMRCYAIPSSRTLSPLLSQQVSKKPDADNSSLPALL